MTATEAPEKPTEDEAVPDPEIVQPADVDDGAPSTEIVVAGRGSLSMVPGQKNLNPEQTAALVAIGIDTRKDPGVQPHVRPFMHMCQVRGLDPWAREAYLIGRGKGDNRKWTMQTSIDGYRKIAASTGRFIRVKTRLWTGTSDDPDSWFRDVDPDTGDVIMRRIWFDQWPASKGHPGSSKVTIEHYDEYGVRTTTSVTADWEMFAPYNDVWEDKPGGGRRPKIGPDGEKVRELTDMWLRGGPHMLAKCAEALCHRTAFPAQMSGVYTHEEMHVLDQRERQRLAAEQAQERRAAIVARETTKAVAAAPEGEPGEAASGPLPLGDVAEAVVEEMRDQAPAEPEGEAAPEFTDAERLTMLRREVEFQAEILGKDIATLAKRRIAAVDRKPADFTIEDLLFVTGAHRGQTVAMLEKQGRHPEAVAYRDVAKGQVVDVDTLVVHEAEVVPEGKHPYVDDGGLCRACGEEQDHVNHPDE